VAPFLIAQTLSVQCISDPRGADFKRCTTLPEGLRLFEPKQIVPTMLYINHVLFVTQASDFMRVCAHDGQLGWLFIQILDQLPEQTTASSPAGRIYLGHD
jgi:hypothetical protein